MVMREDSCDVVIPCRDEASGPACPPGARPRGLPPDRGRQRLARRHRRGGPPSRAPRWSPSPGPATAQPCTQGWKRPRRSTWPSWTVTDRWTPQSWSRCSTRSRSGRADLAVGRRRPGLPRGLALARPGGQRDGALVAAPPDRAAAARHRPDARGPPRGAAGAGRGGPPLRLPGRAPAARRRRANWRFVERDISYHPRAAGTKSKVSGSVMGTIRTARDFARVLS